MSPLEHFISGHDTLEEAEAEARLRNQEARARARTAHPTLWQRRQLQDSGLLPQTCIPIPGRVC